MELERKIEHCFDLSGMESGDWFLGCKRCWFQVEKRAAAVVECPECWDKMTVYYVTEVDVLANKSMSEQKENIIIGTDGGSPDGDCTVIGFYIDDVFHIQDVIYNPPCPSECRLITKIGSEYEHPVDGYKYLYRLHYRHPIPEGYKEVTSVCRSPVYKEDGRLHDKYIGLKWYSKGE